uniref:Uncharacterized protein n=1 Tax=Fundulus heteroclitus TaxID=8078 RepID=A0A3Q2QCX4_FUNHE
MLFFKIKFLLHCFMPTSKVPLKEQHESVAVVSGQEEKRPLMTKRSVTNCESKFDNYCMNSGKCIFLVELKENHCKYVHVLSVCGWVGVCPALVLCLYFFYKCNYMGINNNNSNKKLNT